MVVLNSELKLFSVIKAALVLWELEISKDHPKNRDPLKAEGGLQLVEYNI